MRSKTNREYRTWMRWLENEDNNPSRSDWYAMQIAAEIRRSGRKDPNSVAVRDLKLTLKREKVVAPVSPTASSPTSALDSSTVKATVTAFAKSKWFAVTGFGGKASRIKRK